MTNRNKILVIGSAFTIGLACGFYAHPSRIEEKEITKDVKQEEKDKQENKNKVVTIVEKTNADGSKTKTTVITDRSIIDTKDNLHEQIDTDKEKITTYDTSSLKVSLLISKSFQTDHYADPLVYGVGIDKKVLGPIWMGAFGYTNRNLGVSFGLMF